MNLSRLNKYQIMWIFVHFDLPTETKAERKAASTFRSFLLKDGFTMMQFSMYSRHCSSRENSDVHKVRVKTAIPEKGHVIVFEVTDAQFGRIEMFHGQKKQKSKQSCIQLSLF